MTIAIGTVTVEATQLEKDVDVVITDRIGITRKMVFPDDQIHEVPWPLIAAVHVHYSQFKTGRN